MSILDTSYGSIEEVAALVKRYTSSGVFVAAADASATRPTLEDVERFIDRISGLINTDLAQAGFNIPVTQPMAKAALSQLGYQ